MITKPFVAFLGMSVLSLSGLVSPVQNNLLPAWEVEYVSASTTVPEIVTLRKELVPICACESTGSLDGVPTHYDKNGNVLHGKINHHDIGICQINTDYHEKAALSMNLDIFKEEDNIKYANWLYSKQGAQPWSWSNGCHHSLK